MDTTALGFPYAEPGDAIADYPAVSQTLAELIEASVPVLVAHVDQPSGLASVPASTEAGANSALADIARTYLAVPHLFTFYCPSARPALTLGATLTICLFDGSTAQGNLAFIQNTASGSPRAPVFAQRRLIPSAGSHTYSVRAYSSAGGLLDAGAGGAGQHMPMVLRILRGGGI